MRRYKRRRGSVGSLGAMTTTSKVLLVTAGVGGAVFLLWRFWPKSVPVEDFVPYEEELLETSDYETKPLPQESMQEARLPAAARPLVTLREGFCPPGTELNPATGECAWVIY